MKKQTEIALRAWERSAGDYDQGIAKFERLLLRGGHEWIGTRATGRVLDVAIGTGRSLPFYAADVVVTGVGLGRNPIRTMLILVIVMGALGALFTIRESWLLYAAGIWLYMAIIPAVEASEQTVIQKVVPFRTQGRVFGFAQAFEAGAAPITAFAIAPIAEFFIIPYMNTDAGQDAWGWLLGAGEARGIALVFLFAGLTMIVFALLAFLTKSYRILSARYQDQTESVVPGDVDGADLDAESSATR